jgi:hypothetical protein
MRTHENIGPNSFISRAEAKIAKQKRTNLRFHVVVKDSDGEYRAIPESQLTPGQVTFNSFFEGYPIRSISGKIGYHSESSQIMLPLNMKTPDGEKQVMIPVEYR